MIHPLGRLAIQRCGRNGQDEVNFNFNYSSICFHEKKQFEQIFFISQRVVVIMDIYEYFCYCLTWNADVKFENEIIYELVTKAFRNKLQYKMNLAMFDQPDMLSDVSWENTSVFISKFFFINVA